MVNQFPQLSSYAAVVARLNALGEAHQAATAAGTGAITVVEDDATFACEGLTLRTAAVLTALLERGTGCVVLGGGDFRPDQFDVVIEIGADGTWLRRSAA